MGLIFVESSMERRSRLEDISKQSGWGNTPPNPTDGKLMHIHFYRNYTFFKSDIHLNRCLSLVHVIVFPVRDLSWSKGTTNIVMRFCGFLKD